MNTTTQWTRCIGRTLITITATARGLVAFVTPAPVDGAPVHVGIVAEPGAALVAEYGSRETAAAVLGMREWRRVA